MNSTWHHDHDHDQHPHASDLSEKKKSWGDVESGGFHENKKTTWEWDSHDKKKSWDDDDASNPNLDNKNRSWNGPSWDDDNHEKTKSKSWNGPSWDDSGLNKKVCEKNDYFLPKQHNVANDSHINNENIVSEEQPSKQILTSVEEQVENGKTPKKKQEVIGNLAENAQKEQEHINTEKVEKGSIGNDEKSTQQCREIDPNHVRSNSGGDNLKKESWSHRQDHSRSSSHNRNSRKHYDDGDDVKDDRCHQSNRVTNIQCKFFAAGNCKRDDCKFSHDVSDARNYDRRSHDNPRAHKKMTWHDDDLKASDLSEKHKSSWNGPTWDDVESGSFNEKNKKTTWDSHDFDDKKKSTTRDDMSNPNSDNKNKSWDDVESGGFNENKKTAWESQNCDDKRKSTKRDDMSNLNLDNKNMSWDEVDASKSNAKSGNNIDEKSKSWVKMDNNSNNKKMRNEKNDHFLPQQHNVVNDSHINNDNVVSEEEPNQQIVTTEQNLTNAIDYLKSLPNSTTHNQEGNNNVMEIENGKTPKKKQEETVGKGKGSENEKGKEGNNGNDEKCMRQFRAALVEFVKEILKPKWKEGRMTREVYKSVVKKVIDKITTTIQQVQIPKTQPKIELYLTHSKPKITKLVEAYVEKLVKA
ncbi:unnamed protein product [Lactuca saligna]|uniref:C3H1-type domain-containing protein n=1 Tax=Lactuca saligna TaxID=75948 RepID=A0AA36A357_LACSI|nr:unnamed protein product [Lactuca saligna]